MFPVDHGFFMPAEWHVHQRTFMAWPTREEIWPDGIEEAKRAYATVARMISRYEPVTMLCPDHEDLEVRNFCGKFVDPMPMVYNDSWFRDNGPTFLISENEVRAVHWRFNGWGGKYIPFDDDEEVSKVMLEKLEIKFFEAPIVMEGGSIHVDGEGTLVTTEECLLNPNRNYGMSREEIESVLKSFLGVEKVLWLKGGLVEDQTDGHVDNVAAFVAPATMVMQVCNDPNDPFYTVSQENLRRAEAFTTSKGKQIDIVPIEQPPPRFYKGKRLSLSYVNFYFVNGGLLLPTFGGDSISTDRKARATLTKLLPERKIIPMQGVIIPKGGGNIHCITQQMPLLIRSSVI